MSPFPAEDVKMDRASLYRSQPGMYGEEGPCLALMPGM